MTACRLPACRSALGAASRRPTPTLHRCRRWTLAACWRPPPRPAAEAVSLHSKQARRKAPRQRPRPAAGGRPRRSPRRSRLPLFPRKAASLEGQSTSCWGRSERHSATAAGFEANVVRRTWSVFSQSGPFIRGPLATGSEAVLDSASTFVLLVIPLAC